MDVVFTANIDGAARGNPGPASYGVVLRKPDGTLLESLGKYIGRTTNNVAEYYGLIAALDYAAAHGISRLRVQSDSQLIVNQMKGLYKVKHADLRPLHERARKLASGLAAFIIQYVPREQNRDADAAANAALDATSSSATSSASHRGTAHRDTGNAPPPLTPSRPATHTIRAQFRGGALHPLDPLELADGTVVRLRVEPGES